MIRKISDSKSDTDRLAQAFEALVANQNERITIASTARHNQNLTNHSREDKKFHRPTNFQSLYQQQQQHQQSSHHTNQNSELIETHLPNQPTTITSTPVATTRLSTHSNQRHNLQRSSTNSQLYNGPPLTTSAQAHHSATNQYLAQVSNPNSQPSPAIATNSVVNNPTTAHFHSEIQQLATSAKQPLQYHHHHHHQHQQQHQNDLVTKARINSPLGENDQAKHHQHHHLTQRDVDVRLPIEVSNSVAVCDSNTDNNNTLITREQSANRDNESDKTIRGELSSDLDGSKDTVEPDNLKSLEQELPVELSFLIKQQAYCMAKMNYLDRQIRELKESAQQQQQPTHPAALQQQHHHQNHHHHHHHQHHQPQPQLQQQAHQTQHINSALQTVTANYNNNAIINCRPANVNTIPNNSTNLTTSSNTNATLYHQNSYSAPNGLLLTNTNGGKNGHFIMSDDSGGEYSRATISDDDELSSLLDQIAKSVRADRPSNGQVQGANHQPLTSQFDQPRLAYTHQQQQLQHHHHQQEQQQQIQLQQQQLQQQQLHHHKSNISSVVSHQKQQAAQQYAIINPTQLRHQTVPVFVMSSPIAVAHPSSISSAVLPGVHFQLEPRYNQYYEDFYVQSANGPGDVLAGSVPANLEPSSTIINCSGALINSSTRPNNNNHHHHIQPPAAGVGVGAASQQFDGSISAIENLIGQREKRQIKSQLKSADNWLKMRSSNMCNLNDNNFSSNNTSQANSANVAGGNIISNVNNNNVNTNKNRTNTNPDAKAGSPDGIDCEVVGSNLSTTTIASKIAAPALDARTAAGIAAGSTNSNNPRLSSSSADHLHTDDCAYR